MSSAQPGKKVFFFISFLKPVAREKETETE
jgi:hypothetical protein